MLILNPKHYLKVQFQTLWHNIVGIRAVLVGNAVELIPLCFPRCTVVANSGHFVFVKSEIAHLMVTF